MHNVPAGAMRQHSADEIKKYRQYKLLHGIDDIEPVLFDVGYTNTGPGKFAKCLQFCDGVNPFGALKSRWVESVKAVEAYCLFNDSSESESHQQALVDSRTVCANEGCQVRKANQILKACSVCRSVSYCSKECQKSHWKVHKTVCVADGPKRDVPLKDVFSRFASGLISELVHELLILGNLWTMRAKKAFAYASANSTGGDYNIGSGTNLPIAFIVEFDDSAIGRNFVMPFSYTITPWQVLSCDLLDVQLGESAGSMGVRSFPGLGRTIHNWLLSEGFSQSAVEFWLGMEDTDSRRISWLAGESFLVFTTTKNRMFRKLSFVQPRIEGPFMIEHCLKTTEWQSLCDQVYYGEIICVEPCVGRELEFIYSAPEELGFLFDGMLPWMGDYKMRKKFKDGKMGRDKLKRYVKVVLGSNACVDPQYRRCPHLWF